MPCSASGSTLGVRGATSSQIAGSADSAAFSIR